MGYLLSEVEVDPQDPAFQHPSKPIEVFYDQTEAQNLEEERVWQMVEDAGRGYRRVEFTKSGGRLAIICALDEADLAIQGQAGTWISDN
ncbi:hypothetical protein HU830_07550 [Lactobacillus sp. DCY120]|uniref:Uncharacterized protein n=1 Tax=Bombilactobacillus apium TaxID=2675299 RepID=A0A850R257_9LACO|nr:hypothetical protein [Bombilactobacillus apium]NVY97003.1 hypothetical protein [Bombilactobacillus apium]